MLSNPSHTHHPPTVGVLSPLLGTEYFGNLLLGIHRVVRHLGGRVIGIQTASGWGGSAKVVPLESVRYALDHLDAIIVILDALAVEAQQTFLLSGRPVVSIATFHPELGIPAVYPEGRNGITTMVRHLIQHGHRRIGFSGCLTHLDMVERYEAYQAALRTEGIEPDAHLFFAAPGPMEEDGKVVAEAMLAAGVPCTALCAASDRIALGIMERLQQAGCRVPADVALTGFDGARAADFSIPALTTVRVNLPDVGGTAARLVMAQLAGKHIPAEVVYAATYPVYRQSCGCSSVGTTVPVNLAKGCRPGWLGRWASPVNAGRGVASRLWGAPRRRRSALDQGRSACSRPDRGARRPALSRSKSAHRSVARSLRSRYQH